MEKKPPKTRKGQGPLSRGTGRRSGVQLVPDFHLWSAVGRSVGPLPKRKSTDPKDLLDALEAALNPAPAPPPAKPLPPAPSPRIQTRPAPHTKGLPLLGPIEPGLLRRVARGRLPIDATLDLHGLGQDEARGVLEAFVRARVARGDRTILVITGKGLKKTGYLQIENKGVLRAMLPRWLREPSLAPLIAGMEPAHKDHGGEGAFYIRLKRARS